MSQVVSKAEFSRMAGVSAAAVTNAAKKSLAPAMVGKRVDSAHAAAIEYIRRNVASNPVREKPTADIRIQGCAVG